MQDIFKVLAEHSLSPQQQIDFLRVTDLVVLQKDYPNNIHKIIERKIQLLEQAKRDDDALAESPLQLSVRKGVKVNFIRVINNLFELSIFTDRKGNNTTKKEVFDIFGKAINQDLSTFHNDLSVSKSTANRDMKSSLSIFEQMYNKQLEINQK